MRVGDVCTRSVVHCSRECKVRLRLRNSCGTTIIGNVVVVDERAGRKVPLGIVADRDIVVRLVAKEVDPGDITVTDLMAQGGVRCARRRRYSRCHSAHALSRRETASGR
jgi:hypothetical protein